MSLPLACRYHPGGRTRYHRAKAQIVGLLPPGIRRLSPGKKRTYRSALAASVPTPIEAPTAVAAGLLDPNALAHETDTTTKMTATAAEAWLVGARTAGIRLPMPTP